MTPHRFTRRGLLAAGSAVALASGARPAFSVVGDTLRVRIERDMAILDPAFYVAGEDVILDCVLPTLTQHVRGGTTDAEPYVAESIRQVDDTTIEFTLHEGLVWTNGYGKVTAEDVKFSFERVADPKTESPYADGWATLDRVEVVDERTGLIRLKAPNPNMWVTLSAYNGHFHCARAVADVGGKWTTELPAGCGPYVIAGWEPRQRIVLEHNPDFPLFVPAFKRIEIMPIEDEKAAELAFEAGEVDYTRIANASVTRYRAAPPPEGALFEAAEVRYAWIGMNMEHPTFQDIRVRQAVQYATDVDAILLGAYEGVAARATGMIPPHILGARPANLVQGRDVEKARALLAEAGKADGFDTTITVMNTTEFLAAAQIMQANLAEVGIRAEIMPYDSAVYWNLGLESEGEDWKNLQITFMRYGGSLNGFDILKWLAPDQVGIWNWERHNSAEMGELLKKAQVELDDETRAAQYRRIQDIMEESGCYIYLTHGVAASIYRNGLDVSVRPDFVPQLRRFARA